MFITSCFCHMYNQRKWGTPGLLGSTWLEVSEIGPTEVPAEVSWASCWGERDLFGRRRGWCPSWEGGAWGDWAVCIYEKWDTQFCRPKILYSLIQVASLWCCVPKLGSVDSSAPRHPRVHSVHSSFYLVLGRSGHLVGSSCAVPSMIGARQHQPNEQIGEQYEWLSTVNYTCSLRKLPEKIAITEAVWPPNKERRKTFIKFGLVIDKL